MSSDIDFSAFEPVVSHRGVALRDGWGFVSASGWMRSPCALLAAASDDFDPASHLFHVVEVDATEVAVVDGGTARAVPKEARAPVIETLHRRYPVVAWIDADAVSAAVVRCSFVRVDREAAVRWAAVAAWGVKAIAGWDISPIMTFSLATSGAPGTVPWLSAYPSREGGTWTVRTRSTMRRWTRVPELVRDLPDPTHLVVFDVDWALAFSDAYGGVEGDLMLGCVDAAIQSTSGDDGAIFARVGGNELLVALSASTVDEAEAFAEKGRRAVEKLHIPSEHPQIATKGIVTVSAAVVPLSRTRPATLEEYVKAAVCEAKRRGRNCVFVDR